MVQIHIHLAVRKRTGRGRSCQKSNEAKLRVRGFPFQHRCACLEWPSCLGTDLSKAPEELNTFQVQLTCYLENKKLSSHQYYFLPYILTQYTFKVFFHIFKVYWVTTKGKKHVIYSHKLHWNYFVKTEMIMLPFFAPSCYFVKEAVFYSVCFSTMKMGPEQQCAE